MNISFTLHWYYVVVFFFILPFVLLWVIGRLNVDRFNEGFLDVVSFLICWSFVAGFLVGKLLF